jgi:hypothetical protein
MSADAAFADISVRLLGEPDIDEGTGFGKNPGLRVNGKIFAMIVRGDLVMKLPANVCTQLVEAGRATYFVVGKKEMREWVNAGSEPADDWPALVTQALEFVRPR